MANVPYPITAETISELKRQVFELVRQIYEEKIGGADLGDVFSLPGDVLTLVLTNLSGLTKEGNALGIIYDLQGGLQISINGLSIKILSTGGLQTNVSGLGIKLDGNSLELSADGLKVTSGVGGIPEYLGKLSSDPDTGEWGSSDAGKYWFNTTEGRYKYWDGTKVLQY